jgi:hypothetical protein
MRPQAYRNGHDLILHFGEDLGCVRFRLRMDRLVKQHQQDLATKLSIDHLLESANTAPDGW